MFVKNIVMVFAIVLTTAFSANAQNTPSDVRDLIGERASSGERQLQRRGYRFVKTTKGDDRSYSNWWKSSSRACITVATMNGRYDSIITTPAPDCNQNSSSGGSGGGNSGRVDVSDLIGARGSTGETELQRRGFRLVDSAKGNHSYTHWYRSRSRQCIMVVTMEGRYADIVTSRTSECR